MGAPNALTAVDTSRRRRIWLGVVLLGVGLLGHLLAAHAIGGSSVAYTHHIAGFFGLSVVSGGLIAALGWRFWRGRHDITLLILGGLQALLGVMVYVAEIFPSG